MNQQELGDRFRKARALAGISQQAAADALSVPRTAITQLEAGKRSVSTLELAQLAALYHRPVMYFLEESEEAGEDLLVALHRIAPGLNADPAVKAQVNRYVDWCREGYHLERLLGRGPRSAPPTYLEPDPRTGWEAVEQGGKIAEQERKRLGMGYAPVPDMADLINEQHLWASGADFPDSMSGLFLCHPSLGLAILVNAKHTRARKRFSYAHEYAHALLDRALKVTVSDTRNASELLEKRANAFAAAFLMPTEGIAALLNRLDKGKPSRAEMTIFDVATEGRVEAHTRPGPHAQRITYQDIALIAHHFGVSYQAAAYRLSSLRHLSPKECEARLAQVEFGKQYLKVLDMFEDLEAPEEKKRSKRELRNHIAHRAIEAYRREKISRGKLLDLGKLLEIPTDQWLNLAEAARMNE